MNRTIFTGLLLCTVGCAEQGVEVSSMFDTPPEPASTERIESALSMMSLEEPVHSGLRARLLTLQEWCAGGADMPCFTLDDAVIEAEALGPACAAGDALACDDQDALVVSMLEAPSDIELTVGVLNMEDSCMGGSYAVDDGETIYGEGTCGFQGVFQDYGITGGTMEITGTIEETAASGSIVIQSEDLEDAVVTLEWSGWVSEDEMVATVKSEPLSYGDYAYTLSGTFRYGR